MVASAVNFEHHWLEADGDQVLQLRLHADARNGRHQAPAREIAAALGDDRRQPARAVDEEANGIAVMREEFLVGKGGPARQSTELLVGVMFRNLKLFLGPAWNPLRVCFSHAPPRDPSLHFQLFGYGVYFGQDFNGIVCTTSDMDAPNPMADPVMARYARQVLEASAGTTRMNAVDSVRNILLVLLPSGQCSIEQVAQQLGVDRQTVHRRLVREGTAFREVVNTIRRELAAHYIDDGTAAAVAGCRIARVLCAKRFLAVVQATVRRGCRTATPHERRCRTTRCLSVGFVAGQRALQTSPVGPESYFSVQNSGRSILRWRDRSKARRAMSAMPCGPAVDADGTLAPGRLKSG